MKRKQAALGNEKARMAQAYRDDAAIARIRRGGGLPFDSEPRPALPVRTWFVVRGCRIKRMRARHEPYFAFETFEEAKAGLVNNLQHDIAALEDELKAARRLKERDV